MSTPMIRVSRSAIATRKGCEMRRYLGYDLRGHGISPVEFKESKDTISLEALPKVRGQLFHELSLAIVQGASSKDVKELVAEKSTVFPPSIRMIQSTLIRRAMMGWELIRSPWWKANFDVMSAEKSWTWQLSQRVQEPIRMDKILRHKDTGALGIFDFKTIGSVDPNWIRRMETSDQSHLYIQALKEYTDEWVMGMCYDAVVIGRWDKKKGIQKSPFVLGYLKNGTVNGKWLAGSSDYDLTSFSDEKWLEWIQKQPDMLESLYITSGFINPPPSVLLHTKNSVARAEEEWYDRVQIVEDGRHQYGEDSPEYGELLALIERNSQECYNYGWDYACPFINQCWNGQKIDQEDFVQREDHHKEDHDAPED